MDTTSAPMHGKVALVTGGTSGIGKATATALAALGATVIVVGRGKIQGEAALADIQRATDNPSVELMLADLASQSAVRQLVYTFKAHHPHLHIFVNNAGGMTSQRTMTDEGFESTFAINYLAPFLLTNLLLPTLYASTPARIVNVASNIHKIGRINFDDLQGATHFQGFRGAYVQSKLAILLFTYELARRLNGTGVTVNAVDPGSVKTNVYRDVSGLIALMGKVGAPFYTAPERGAQGSLYAATSPAISEVTGKYFNAATKMISSSKASYDVALAQRLWNVSSELTHLSPDPIMANG